MTKEQIAELRRLEKEATPSPWRAGGYNGTETVADVVSDSGRDATEYDEATNLFRAKTIIQRDGGVYPPRREDEAFIRVARNAFPRLLAEREALLAACRSASERLSLSADPWERDPVADELAATIAKAEAP